MANEFEFKDFTFDFNQMRKPQEMRFLVCAVPPAGDLCVCWSSCDIKNIEHEAKSQLQDISIAIADKLMEKFCG